MTRVLRYSPLLLLAAALVALAVLFVNYAPPASADHGRANDVWSTTLRVQGIQSANGCNNSSPSASARCSSTSVLTDDDFRYAGVDYAFTQIFVDTNNALTVVFDKAIPTAIRSGGTLHVNSNTFRLANAAFTTGNTVAIWANTGLNWAVGQLTVQLKLAAPYWTGVDLYGGGLVHHSDGAQTMDIDENGAGTFLVRLDQAPTANVTITLQKNFSQCSACGREYHGDVNAATVSPKTLTFTPSNYSTGRAVRVTGVPDSDTVHEHLGIWARVSIASGANSDDPYHNPERVNGIWVTIHDGSDDGSSHGGL